MASGKQARPSKPLPPGFLERVWKPGQSGNPAGLNGLFGETMKLAREASPGAMKRLIELMASEDERVASVACNAVLDRAWGKPKEPKEEPSRPRPDLSRLTDKQLAQLRAILRAMVEPLADGPVIDGEAR